MSEQLWTVEHGHVLRERRVQRGLSQEALAEAAGVTVRTIRALEHGYRPPRPSTIQLLAEALGCGAEDVRQGLRLPSIAVLPFKNLTGDEEQEYFCEGLSEELINALVHLEGMRVAARTSSFHFKDQREDLHAIGEALGAETVLEGSVRLADGRFRITAQLIQVEDGFHLWSEQFDRRSGDIFTIQEEISQAIVDKLRVELTAGEQEQLVKQHTVDDEAHRLYLKGRYFWQRRHAVGLKDALVLFQQTLDRDPLHAPAYVGIAGCYLVLGIWNLRPCREVMPKARQAAERALEIDDTLADAHAARAMVRFHYDWDWPAAEQQFRQAIALNPRDATTRSWYASALGLMGRSDEALAEAEHGHALDPLSPFCSLIVGTGLYHARRYEEALERFNAILEVDPRFLLATHMVGVVHLALCNYEKSVAAFEQVVALTNEGGLALGNLGMACAAAGWRDRAFAVLDRMQAISKERWIAPGCIAMVHCGLGDEEKVLDLCEAACEGREAGMLPIKTDPIFDPYRETPWYQEVERMVGIWD